MKQPVERRLAAILTADAPGYSRLIRADGEATPVVKTSAKPGSLTPQHRPAAHRHNGECDCRHWYREGGLVGMALYFTGTHIRIRPSVSQGRGAAGMTTTGALAGGQPPQW
jgi:hypothetical protein